VSIAVQQAQEIHSIFQEIYGLLTQMSVATRQLAEEAPRAAVSGGRALMILRQVERIALRVLVLLKDMGLPPDVEKAVAILSKLVMTLYSVIAMLSAINPVMFVLHALGAIVAFSSIAEGY